MSHNFISPSYQQPLTNSGTFTSVPKCHKESSKDLQQPSSLLPSHILGAWYQWVPWAALQFFFLSGSWSQPCHLTAAATKVCLVLSFPVEVFIPYFIIIFPNPARKCCLAPTFLRDFMLFVLGSPVLALETCPGCWEMPKGTQGGTCQWAGLWGQWEVPGGAGQAGHCQGQPVWTQG